MTPEVIVKRFERPDEIRVFEKGRLEIVRIGSMIAISITWPRPVRWRT